MSCIWIVQFRAAKPRRATRPTFVCFWRNLRPRRAAARRRSVASPPRAQPLAECKLRQRVSKVLWRQDVVKTNSLLSQTSVPKCTLPCTHTDALEHIDYLSCVSGGASGVASLFSHAFMHTHKNESMQHGFAHPKSPSETRSGVEHVERVLQHLGRQCDVSAPGSGMCVAL